MRDIISMFVSILLQLETFTLDFEGDDLSLRKTRFFYKHVKMSKLKQLVVIVDIDPSWVESLLPLANLICASPCFERFVLKHCCNEAFVSCVFLRATRFKLVHVEREIVKIQKMRSYSHLKEVEFVGYNGHASELELVMHILVNVVALEKIIVNTCRSYETYLARVSYNSCGIRDKVIGKEKDATARAKK